MGLMDLVKDERIHSRNISVNIYPVDDNTIIVRGELKDDRLAEHYTMTGKPSTPGVVHHMFINLRVIQQGFEIKEIEVEMPGIPRNGCIEAQDSLDWLIGERITAGFTSKVKSKVGKGEGCNHLSALLLAMAPMILQGFYTQLSRVKRDNKDMAFLVSSFLKNTCLVWKEDGRHYIDTLKELSQE
ncbi:MAG: DUF2889 domain-containing protein [Desulfobacterales bacterium]|nr:DUF2889 domain-containing protein [Desulfobacterales bacterium]MCP4163250.1 DUF2889 domain-containing protein [Deltaproteobacteria bacterium]